MPSPDQLYGPDRSILITGASSGIGAALALHLARYRGRLALTARRGDLLEELAEKVRAAGAHALPLAGDVTDLESVRELHRRIQKEQGPVDVAFLNAGVGGVSALRHFDPEQVRRLFEVNVFGVTNWLGLLLPEMLERRGGVIAGTSSLAAARGFPGGGVYAASKAAVSHLLESLRVEAAARGIQITIIEPGFIRTALAEKNRFPMPLMMECAEAAALISAQVAEGRRLVRFPWPMAAAAQLIGALPAPLFDAVGRALLRKQRPRA